MEHSKGNDLINHPTAWKTLTTFHLKDFDKNVIPGTATPVYQIHIFPMWYYEGLWFGLTDVLAATDKHVPGDTNLIPTLPTNWACGNSTWPRPAMQSPTTSP